MFFIFRLPVFFAERGVLPPHPRFWVSGAERRVFHRTVGRIFESDIFMKINRLCRI